MFVGTPTWPNHPPIIRAVGLEIGRISLLRPRAGRIRFDDMIARWSGASRATSPCSTAAATTRPAPTLSTSNGAMSRDVVPSAACSRSSTSPTRALDAVSTRMRSASRLMLDACDEVIIAHSCDKNFSVYRDRVGSLWVKTGIDGARPQAMEHVLQRAREMWSMPPDHGAAAVRIVLDDAGAACALAGRARRRCATGSIRCASGSRPRIRGSPSSAGSSACSRCCRSQGAGAGAARGPRDLHGR